MAVSAEYDDVPRAQGRRARHVNDPVWRMLSGTFVFMFGVFVCGAVGTFDPTDPSLNTATTKSAENLFGGAGAAFADFACQSLGWAAWCGGLAAMVGGAMRAVLIGRPSGLRWWLGFMAVPLAAACFAAWPVPANWPLRTGLGGVMGDGIFHMLQVPLKALLIPLTGLWAALMAGTLALCCALTALGFRRDDARLLHESATRTSRDLSVKAKGISGRISAVMAARREKRAERRSWEAGMEADRARPGERFVLPDMEGTEDLEREDDDVFEPLTEEVENIGPAPEADAKPRSRTKATAASKSGTAKPRRKPALLPPLDLLQTPPSRRNNIDEDALLAKAQNLHRVLQEFGVKGRVTEVRPGPVVTLFEFEPAPGVRSNRVIALADDIARSMNATAARVAVIPGKNAMGIELPNEDRQTVYFRPLLQNKAFSQGKAKLPLVLGENIGGDPVVVELAKMPHLLIAGTTGSGKSVGINAMILSLIYKLTPEQCRFIMIDPKMLELSIYEGIPHLLAPVVTDPQKAVVALKWAVREMENRYEIMSKAGVRNMAGFNEKVAQYAAEGKQLARMVQTGYDEEGKPIREFEDIPLEPMANIVVIIDEMADLMMVAGKEIEGCVQRLAQMARAAGIHLITATQRPSVDVITGTIKANFPTRISYSVTTKIDSRTILGEQGAEQLLGMGDLLYQAAGVKSMRCHGPFVSDEEVEAVVSWLKENGEADYRSDILEEPEGGEDSPVMDAIFGGGDGGEEDLYRQAVEVVIRDGRASTSYIQRRLKIGYNRAASLIERMEDEGIVGQANHAGKREILKKHPDAADD